MFNSNMLPTLTLLVLFCIVNVLFGVNSSPTARETHPYVYGQNQHHQREQNNNNVQQYLPSNRQKQVDHQYQLPSQRDNSMVRGQRLPPLDPGEEVLQNLNMNEPPPKVPQHNLFDTPISEPQDQASPDFNLPVVKESRSSSFNMFQPLSKVNNNKDAQDSISLIDNLVRSSSALNLNAKDVQALRKIRSKLSDSDLPNDSVQVLVNMLTEFVEGLNLNEYQRNDLLTANPKGQQAAADSNDDKKQKLHMIEEVKKRLLDPSVDEASKERLIEMAARSGLLNLGNNLPSPVLPQQPPPSFVEMSNLLSQDRQVNPLIPDKKVGDEIFEEKISTSSGKEIVIKARSNFNNLASETAGLDFGLLNDLNESGGNTNSTHEERAVIENYGKQTIIVL